MFYFNFRNLQAWGYQLPPSVDIGCFPYLFTKFLINLYSAINIVLSIEIWTPRIILSVESITAIQIQTNRLLILIKVSSTISILSSFSSFAILSLALYSWIQFQIETWFLLINGNNLSEIFLKDKPEEYNCSAYRECTLKVLFWSYR